MRKSARVFIPSTAFRYTLPPRPPSPPSGPPKGTNFSRRKLTQPRPPLPACTFRVASSTNFMKAKRKSAARRTKKKGAGCPTPLGFLLVASRLGSRATLFGNDVDVGVLLGTLDPKLDHAVGLREQRVVGADTDVHAGAIHRSALTDQDVTREHILAAEFLDAQTLGMGIAAVTSAAARFFVCHEVSPAKTRIYETRRRSA